MVKYIPSSANLKIYASMLAKSILSTLRYRQVFKIIINKKLSIYYII